MNNTKHYDNKLSQIRKYYKKTKLLLELQLISYDEYNLYIRLDYFKKQKTYRLSWYDLDMLDDSIEKNISFEYVTEDFVDSIFKILDRRNTDQEVFYNEEPTNGIVIMSLYCYDKIFTYKFYKYIPKKIAFLSDMVIIIFNSLPRKLQGFLYELHAELENNVTRYEYKKEFSFDLFNDDINKIFAYQIIERGKKYYEEEKVKFLEKINDRYFAIVEGTEKYVVVINYNDELKKTQVYCSCPCEFYCKHIYSVILAIRNNKFNRFYKISYRNPNKNILEQIMEFDYSLCIGVIEQNFEILNNYGQIELIPILDVNNKNNWQVLEDSEDEYLAKQIQKVVRGEWK